MTLNMRKLYILPPGWTKSFNFIEWVLQRPPDVLSNPFSSAPIDVAEKDFFKIFVFLNFSKKKWKQRETNDKRKKWSTGLTKTFS